MSTGKKCSILFTVLLFVLSVSACGVSKDDYEKVVTELEKTKSELSQARAKISEMEKGLDIPKIDTEMMEKLKAAQDKAGELTEKVKSLTTDNKLLSENVAKLKSMLGDLQEKLKSIQGNTGGLPLDLLKKP